MTAILKNMGIYMSLMVIPKKDPGGTGAALRSDESKESVDSTVDCVDTAGT